MKILQIATASLIAVAACAAIEAWGCGSPAGGAAFQNANPPPFHISPEMQAAWAKAKKRQEEARTLIAQGREAEAISHLKAAKAEFGAVAGRGSAGRFDLVMADAYIFLRRDAEALTLLREPGLRRNRGTAPRIGLLLARNGRVGDSIALDPTDHALHFWTGYGEDVAQALPQPGVASGLVATWCLAIAQDEDFGWHKGIAERYYKLGLAAQPGQPLLSLSYGLFLRLQGRAAEAVPLVEASAKRLTGHLKSLAEAELAEIRTAQAKAGAPAVGK